MSTAREIAIELLPSFTENVLAKRVRSYGWYAAQIGRSPAKESMVIGMGMHAIGAACVFANVPVAPLYYVERQDGEWRGVFEAGSTESIHILPHYDLLYVTAREHQYTRAELDKLDLALREVLPKILPSDYLSPHDLWQFAVHYQLENQTTPWLEAVEYYRGVFETIRIQKKAARGIRK